MDITDLAVLLALLLWVALVYTVRLIGFRGDGITKAGKPEADSSPSGDAPLTPPEAVDSSQEALRFTWPEVKKMEFAEEELGEVSDRIETMESGINHLKRQVGKWNLAAAKAIEENNDWRSRCDKLQADLRRLQENLDEAGRVIAANREANETDRSVITSLQGQNQSLAKQLEVARLYAAEYESMWNDAEQRLIQLQTSIKPRTRGMQS